MLEIDHYAYQNRWRSVNPLIKAAVFAGLMLLALCSNIRIQGLILLVLIPVTCYASHISLKKYTKWLILPLAFLLLSMLGIMLSFAWSNQQMLASFQLGSLHIGLSKDSLLKTPVTST